MMASTVKMISVLMAIGITFPAVAVVMREPEPQPEPQPSTLLLAQMRRVAFTVTKTYPNSIYVQSTATGNIFEVYYPGRIGCGVGDTVTVLIDSSDTWKRIICEATGNSAVITDVYRR